MAHAGEQEIVYRDRVRSRTATLDERIHRLAAGLARLGVVPGDTVGVLDWDSHRYLECFFAVPMMGAVLHTVNVRLSPEQILYTIDARRGRRPAGQRRVPAGPGAALATGCRGSDASSCSATWTGRRTRACHCDGEYEALLAASPPSLRLPGPRRGHLRHDVLHDRHDGAAQGRVLQPPPAGAAHAGGLTAMAMAPSQGGVPRRRRLHADHAHVPRARLGLPVHGHAAWA